MRKGTGGLLGVTSPVGHLGQRPCASLLPLTLTSGQPLGALHVLLERWAPLLCFLLTEAEVCHFRPG